MAAPMIGRKATGGAITVIQKWFQQGSNRRLFSSAAAAPPQSSPFPSLASPAPCSLVCPSSPLFPSSPFPPALHPQIPCLPPSGGSMELMAVPKKKVTPHRKGLRNGRKVLKPVPVIVRCKSCGRVKLPHFYCCSGDRGKSESAS